MAQASLPVQTGTEACPADLSCFIVLLRVKALMSHREHRASGTPAAQRRICCVTRTTLPSRAANAIQVMKMCEAMVKGGRTAILLASARDSVPPDLTPAFWEEYGVRRPFSVAWISSRGWLASHRHGWRAARWAMRESQDLIYTRHLPTAGWAGIFGAEVILELHYLTRRPLEWLYLRMLRGARRRRLVVISRALRDDFTLAYPGAFPNDEVVVAHDGMDLAAYGADLSREKSRQRLSLQPDALIAGYAGHFYRGKGVETILPLARRCPEWLFVLVGGTEEDTRRVRRILGESGLANVRVFDHVPHASVPDWLAACDALLLPLQSRVEVAGGGGDIGRWTSPLKLFEYMASGRPIVASALPVLREVLDDGNSFICEVGALEQWVEVLRQLRIDPEAGRAKGNQARIDARKYSWEARVSKCLRGWE